MEPTQGLTRMLMLFCQLRVAEEMDTHTPVVLKRKVEEAP